jgi:WD40 repeat protein/serine/threonine protein kinase
MQVTNPALQAVFSEAVEITDPAARAAYLQGVCQGNGRLLERVERLLRADSEAGGFFRDQTEVPAEKIGERVGRYRLLELIGRGGCGVVYLARQEEPVRRLVALKVIKLGMDTRSVVVRFEAERQALALMDHPNIARVLDAGATETGRPFFVMELVTGMRLTEYCDRKGLTTRQRLELFIPVCHAVQHAHQKGIIHRDLKPSNILVTEQDGVPLPKVIDFGVAKATEERLTEQTITRADQFVGTPAYMSPEQMEWGAKDIDTRSDIYSLGVVLYELMAGQPPFNSKELAEAGLDEMRRKIREVDPPRPSTRIFSRAYGQPLTPGLRERQDAVRGDVDWIVMKCLEKDRTRRYQTANGLASDIRRHLEDETVLARPPSRVYRFRKIVRRNRLAFSAAATVAVVLIGAVLMSGTLAIRAKRAEHEQRRLRGLAELKSEESRQRLLRRYVAEGNGLVEKDDPLGALPFLIEALQVETGDPVREAQERLRIAQALENVPQLVLNICQGKRVECVAFSPDGKFLATGSEDRTLIVCNLQSRQQCFSPLLLRDVVSSVTFSPDGLRVAGIDLSGWARVWNADDGTPLTDGLRPEDFDANSVDDVVKRLRPSVFFSPDGTRLLTAWGSKSAHLWEINSGKHLYAFGHTQVVYRAAFSPDGRHVVTSSKDGAACVWDTATGQRVKPPLQHGGRVVWAAFSPDGERVLTIKNRSSVQCWDWRNAERIGPELASGHSVFEASFSPDSQRVLVANWDRTARLYELPSGKIIKAFEHPGGLVDAVFSPDGSRIATACYDGNAWIWHVAGDKNRVLAVLPQFNETDCVRFSPDGRQLAVAGRGGLARVWDLFPARSGVQRFSGRDVVWAEFDSSARKFLTAGGLAEGNVRVFETQTRKLLSSTSIRSNTIACARFSPDGKRVLAFGNGSTAHVCDADTGQEIFPPLAHRHEVRDARWSSDGRWIATASGRSGARLWDSATGKAVREFPHPNAGAAQVAFGPDGKLLATGEGDDAVRVWETATGKQALPSMKSPTKVRQLHFRPDGRRLAFSSYSRGTEGIVHLRDVVSGAEVGRPMVHRDEILNFEFTPDNRWVLTASKDHTARVWDAETGEPVSPWLRHPDEVSHVQVSPGGHLLATVTSPGDVQLWNPTTGEPITRSIRHGHRGAKGRVGFSADGRQLLVATGADEYWIHDLTPATSALEEFKLQAQVLSGRKLDADFGMVALDLTSLSNAWRQLCILRERK